MHVIETALSLLKQASMPHKFWDEAICTAVYLINRMPTSLLSYKSPYSLLFTQEPNYKFLRNFGCAYYPYLRHYAASKLDSRLESSAFIGYNAFHHGCLCICWDLRSITFRYFDQNIKCSEKTLNRTFKIPSDQEQMIISSSMYEKIYLQGFLEGVLEAIQVSSL